MGFSEKPNLALFPLTALLQQALAGLAHYLAADYSVAT